jgi:hypothetical protein
MAQPAPAPLILFVMLPAAQALRRRPLAADAAEKKITGKHKKTLDAPPVP